LPPDIPPAVRTLVERCLAKQPSMRYPTAAALAAAARAADAGALATAQLQARLGRSSYVGEAAVGVPDPGARAVALLLHCGARAAGPALTPKETHA
jgi:dihydroxyacetone kinase